AFAAQEAVLRMEREGVDPAAEPRRPHRELDVARIDCAPRLARPRPPLGRHAALEDRELEREVAVAEHPPAVRPPLERLPVRTGRGTFRAGAGRNGRARGECTPTS